MVLEVIVPKQSMLESLPSSITVCTTLLWNCVNTILNI